MPAACFFPLPDRVTVWPAEMAIYMQSSHKARKYLQPKVKGKKGKWKVKSQRKMSPKKLSLRNAKSENICTFATVEQMLRVPLSCPPSLSLLLFVFFTVAVVVVVVGVPRGHLRRIRDVGSLSTVPATPCCLLSSSHLFPALSVINDSTRGSWQQLLLSLSIKCVFPSPLFVLLLM